MTKFDYAATLAASLATLLVEQQDSVGLALFDNEERQVLAPAATQAQLAHIIHTLEQAKPDRTTELGPVLQTLAGKLKKRGLVIVLSDLLTDLEAFYEGLSRLQYMGHDILVFQILDKDEMDLPFNDLVLFRDIEGSEELFAEPWGFRKAYCNAMQQFVAEVHDRCGCHGIEHLLVRTDENLSASLSHYLHRRERMVKGF
jgi:uncharacterized protein (DUF58 family)